MDAKGCSLVAATIPGLRDQLMAEKEAFDLAVLSKPQLSQAQRLRLWEEFLDGVRPIARKLALAEAQYQKQLERQRSRGRRGQIGAQL